MLITVERFASDTETTISLIRVDGEFVCFGLEDEYREVKVKHETRIPEGRYDMKLRKHGGFHARYAERFADIHEGMLEVMEVPGFTDILIHVGNRERDTSGCLLVGMGATARPGDMSIASSVEAYRRLYPMVVDAAARGELSIEILDRDRA